MKVVIILFVLFVAGGIYLATRKSKKSNIEGGGGVGKPDPINNDHQTL